MNLEDYLVFGLCLGFGLWWLLFPQSVLGFYKKLHRHQVNLPNTFGVRIAGVMWLTLIISIMEYIAFTNKEEFLRQLAKKAVVVKLNNLK